MKRSIFNWANLFMVSSLVERIKLRAEFISDENNHMKLDLDYSNVKSGQEFAYIKEQNKMHIACIVYKLAHISIQHELFRIEKDLII